MSRFLKSFGYAFKGWGASFKDGQNFKIQLLAGTCVIIAGFYFDVSRIEWTILLLTIALVLSLEMVNTAIEHLVNLVTRQQNPLAGKIKDIAAGAVLLASVIAATVGVVIFWPYIIY